MTHALRYSTIDDLNELRSAWADLFCGVPNRAFFHRWEWHRAVGDHLFPGQVVYHCFYAGDRLAAVFPFLASRSGAGWPSHRVLQAPGHVEIFLSDALIHEEYGRSAWVDALLSRIARRMRVRPDLIRFDRVTGSSCLYRGLQSLHRRVRHSVVGGSAHCDCARPDSLAHLSAKHLRNVDRLRARAEREMGPVEHVTLTGSAAAGEGLDVFMRVEEAGWKGPTGTRTSLSCTPRARDFYRGVLAGFAGSGDSRIDLLLIRGRPAAAQLGVRCGGTWSLLKMGFDESFASAGPGNVLLKTFIEEMAGTSDVNTVSLVTAPHWAARWHMHIERTYQIGVFAPSRAARILSVKHDLRSFGREVKAWVRGQRWRDEGRWERQ